MSFYRCLKKLPPAPVLWQLPESHLIAAWKHMKWFHVYVCLVEGTRLLHACRYKGRERKYRWKCSFQDIWFFQVSNNSTPSSATGTPAKEDTLSATISDAQMNSSESHAQSLPTAGSLVNNTASSNSAQNQCWETYVGQVCHCYIIHY